MAEPHKRRPLISRRGQLTLYVLVVVIALLAGTYAGIVYFAMNTDIVRMLSELGVRAGSREYGSITALVQMGGLAITVPLAVAAAFALACWGVCLLGWRDIGQPESPSGSRADHSGTLSD